MHARAAPVSRLISRSLLPQAGYKDQVRIAMDVAASEFAVGEIGAGKRPGYDLAKKQPGSNGAGVVTGEALQALYEGMLAKVREKRGECLGRLRFAGCSPAPL